MKSFPRGTLLSATLLLLGVFIVSLKLADMAFGLYADGSDISPRFISLRENAPNLDRYYRLPESLRLSSTPVRVRTDEDAFIVGPQRSEGPVDVIFVGGSTTECAAVNEADRFPNLVSTRLRHVDGGEAIRTLNAGRGGSNTLHATFLVLAKVLKYRPKAVVLMENLNDLTLLANTGSYWQGPPDRTPVQQRHSPWGEFARSVKDVLVPNMWFHFRLLQTSVVSPDLFVGFRINRTPSPQIVEDFRSSLLGAVGILQAWHIQPVLMTQFNRIALEDEEVRAYYGRYATVSWPDYVALYRRFNDVIREIAAASNVPLIDLDREVPKTAQFMYDAVHLKEEGSKFVAEIIARELAAKLDFVELTSSKAASNAEVPFPPETANPRPL